MPVAALTLLLYVMRRIKPATVALVVFETWRRLPYEHRQQLLVAARPTDRGSPPRSSGAEASGRS